MLDITKQFSKKLAINISEAILLPDNYNNVDKVYDAYYILANSNPFIGTDKYQEIVNEKNIALIAIFPSINIKKNQLLFESFESKYDYSYLYEEAIIEQIIPTIERLYRLNNNYTSKHIIGVNDLSLMAYTIAHDFTSTFGHIYSINLDVSNFKNKFLAYYKSKIDPALDLNFKMNDKETLSYMHLIATQFGVVSFNELNCATLIDLIENI